MMMNQGHHLDYSKSPSKLLRTTFYGNNSEINLSPSSRSTSAQTQGRSFFEKASPYSTSKDSLKNSPMNPSGNSTSSPRSSSLRSNVDRLAYYHAQKQNRQHNQHQQQQKNSSNYLQEDTPERSLSPSAIQSDIIFVNSQTKMQYWEEINAVNGHVSFVKPQIKAIYDTLNERYKSMNELFQSHQNNTDTRCNELNRMVTLNLQDFKKEMDQYRMALIPIQDLERKMSKGFEDIDRLESIVKQFSFKITEYEQKMMLQNSQVGILKDEINRMKFPVETQTEEEEIEEKDDSISHEEIENIKHTVELNLQKEFEKQIEENSKKLEIAIYNLTEENKELKKRLSSQDERIGNLESSNDLIGSKKDLTREIESLKESISKLSSKNTGLSKEDKETVMAEARKEYQKEIERLRDSIEKKIEINMTQMSEKLIHLEKKTISQDNKQNQEGNPHNYEEVIELKKQIEDLKKNIPKKLENIDSKYENSSIQTFPNEPAEKIVETPPKKSDVMERVRERINNLKMEKTNRLEDSPKLSSEVKDNERVSRTPEIQKDPIQSQEIPGNMDKQEGSSSTTSDKKPLKLSALEALRAPDIGNLKRSSKAQYKGSNKSDGEFPDISDSDIIHSHPLKSESLKAMDVDYATLGESGIVRFWNSSQGNCLFSVPQSQDTGLKCFTTRENLLINVGGNKSANMYIWDVNTMMNVFTHGVDESFYSGVCISDESNPIIVVSQGYQGGIRAFDISKFSKVYATDLYYEPLTCIAAVPKASQTILAGSKFGKIYTFDLRVKEKVTNTFQGALKQEIHSLCMPEVNATGHLFAFNTTNGAKVFDIRNGKTVFEVCSTHGKINRVAMCGRYIAVAENSKLGIHDMGKLHNPATVFDEASPIRTICMTQKSIIYTIGKQVNKITW